MNKIHFCTFNYSISQTRQVQFEFCHILILRTSFYFCMIEDVNFKFIDFFTIYRLHPKQALLLKDHHGSSLSHQRQDTQLQL